MFPHRNWLFMPLGAVLFLQGLTRLWQAERSEPRTPWLGLQAIGLLVVGIFIRFHVAGRAKPGTSSRGITFEAGQLITTGMYAYLRNPLYLANLMIWAGLALLVGPVWWTILLMGLAGFFYHCVVLAEEEYLAGRYGLRYEQYRRQVPRWIPKISGLFDVVRRTFWLDGPRKTRILYGMVSFPEKCFAEPPSVQRLADSSLQECLGDFSHEECFADAVAPPTTKSEFPAKTKSPASLENSARSASQESTAPAFSPNVSGDSGKDFTWRRALFREADTVMLVLLAGWFFAFLSRGQIPWQPPSGVLEAVGRWVPVVPAIGWLWIKWRKKRSWQRKSRLPSGSPAHGGGTASGIGS